MSGEIKSTIVDDDNVLCYLINVLLLFSSLLLVFGFLLWFFLPEVQSNPNAHDLIAKTRNHLNVDFIPEQIERAIFISLSLAGPLCLVSYFFFKSNLNLEAKSFKIKKITYLIIYLILFICAIKMPGTDWFKVIFYPVSVSGYKLTFIFYAALSFSILVLILSKINFNIRFPKNVFWWVFVTFCSIASVSAYKIVSIEDVGDSGEWYSHLDAVIYPVSQVVNGNTILHDLPSQYGLYPEIVSLIFKITTPGVYSASVLFAILAVIGLLALAFLINKYITNQFIKLPLFLTILLTTTLHMHLSGGVDPYYQYMPIRFVFPAIALLLFSIYTENEKNIILCIMGLFAGLSFIWNIDSAFPIFAAVASTIIFKKLIQKESFLNILSKVAIFVLAATFTVLVSIYLLTIKAGGSLDFTHLYRAQKIFYHLGFGMLPMSLDFDPWQIIIIIYASGMIAGLNGWKDNKNEKKYDILFFCSMLGLGLFTYFQGRSHTFVLILVTWPALIVAGIISDILIKKFKSRKLLHSPAFTTIPFLILISMGAIVFLLSSKQIFQKSFDNFFVSKIINPVVQDEIDFIKNTDLGRGCLILAKLQGIYSLEIGMSSPIPGPGLIETILQSDLDEKVDSILNNKIECIYIGIKKSSMTIIDLKDDLILDKYNKHSKNKLETLLLLEDRK